jgi:hypothetical protein
MRLNTTDTVQLTGWRGRFLFVSLLAVTSQPVLAVLTVASDAPQNGVQRRCYSLQQGSGLNAFVRKGHNSEDIWRNAQSRRPSWKHRVCNVELIAFVNPLKTAVRLNIHYMNSVRTSQETHHVSATKPNRLMLFRETVAVYCENHTEHIDI